MNILTLHHKTSKPECELYAEHKCGSSESITMDQQGTKYWNRDLFKKVIRLYGEELALYFTIFCDVMISATRSACLVVEEDSKKHEDCTITSIVVFALVLVLYLGAISCSLGFLIKCNDEITHSELPQHSQSGGEAREATNEEPSTSQRKEENAKTPSSNNQNNKFFGKIKSLIVLACKRQLSLFIAGFLYILGDNMDLVVREDKHCGETCGARARSASFAFLLIAAVIYLLPLNTFIGDKFEELRDGHRIVERKKEESEEEGRTSNEPLTNFHRFSEQLLPICQAIQHLPKLDTVYTTVTFATKLSNSTCESLHVSYETATWLYFAFIPVLLIALTLVVLIQHWRQYKWFAYKEGCKRALQQCGKQCITDCGIRRCVASCQVTAAVSISLMITAYLLADNEFPLNCATDNTRTLGIARLTLWAIVLIILVLKTVFIFVYLFVKSANTGNQGSNDQSSNTSERRQAWEP